LLNIDRPLTMSFIHTIRSANVSEMRPVIKRGALVRSTGPIGEFEPSRDAHATMDANTAGGKMVVVVP
jgi:hypothetical protein